MGYAMVICFYSGFSPGYPAPGYPPTRQAGPGLPRSGAPRQGGLGRPRPGSAYPALSLRYATLNRPGLACTPGLFSPKPYPVRGIVVTY
jgi:hypothetical protein